MITEDYVSYETAKLLKEKGFDEFCRAFWKVWDIHITICNCSKSHLFEYCHNSMLEQYNDDEELNVAAPTLQMAMKWLREKYYKSIEVTSQGVKATSIGWIVEIFNLINQTEEFHHPYTFPTYEEACEAAIKYCLENLI